MSRHQRNAWLAWMLLAGLLLLPSLACARAGEILTPAEATERARQAAAPIATELTVSQTEFQVGDVVYLAGKAYMINILAEPGGTRMIAQQERGVVVTILEITEHEGETWFKIDAPTGEGWVKAENIAAEKP